MSQSFSGTFDAKGFRADDPAGWALAKRSYLGKRVQVTLAAPDDIRSVFQNRRHFVQCTAVAELWSVGREVPIHPTQAHYILARAFVGVVETPMGDVPAKTRTLTKAQFNAFMDAIDAHFAAEGTPLPTMEPC